MVQEQEPLAQSYEGGSLALNKIEDIITGLKEDGIEPRKLLGHLDYVQQAIQYLLSEHDKSRNSFDTIEENDDAIPELEEASKDLKEWLTTTFANTYQHSRQELERPGLRSVANAIRTGLFIERIYSGLSTSHMMIIDDSIRSQLQTINSWNFDVFEYARITDGSPLKYMGYHILSDYGYINKFKIPPGTLEALLGHLEIGYACYGNPYHNNLHATDVLQTTHWIISETGLKDWMSDLEIFSMLMSAIIHDYNHNGTTNNFHIQSTSDLAVIYNDKSVLENHHVAAFFRVMIDNECNILSNLTKFEFQQLRSLMIEMVLSTDVSHPTKTWDLHKEWTARCMEEFFNQGDREKEMGLDVSPLCDRNTTQVPQSQIEEREEMLENVWLQTLDSNKRRWRDKAESCDTGLEPSGASQDIRPPLVFKKYKKSNVNGDGDSDNELTNGEENYMTRLNSLDNRHLIRQIGPIIMNSTPPAKPTRHRDMIKDVGENVISRPGSPETWNIGLKDSITADPPRPGTSWGAHLSPPQPRRAPISVDHTLRKHALDFS